MLLCDLTDNIYFAGLIKLEASKNQRKIRIKLGLNVKFASARPEPSLLFWTIPPSTSSSTRPTIKSVFFYIVVDLLFVAKLLEMSYSRRSRYSPSPSPPHKRYGRSISRSRSSSRSRSYDASDIENPGNNLYVTGLSARITKRDLEKHFSREGKVEDVHLVIDPWTRESRGFGFVSMSNIKEADRCIKYLDGSVLEGRVITVEKARRRRGRTPTPGRYLGLRSARGRRGRSHTYSSERDRSRSRSYSPYYRRRGRSYSRSRSPSYYSRSPVGRRRSYHYRDYSPEERYYRRSHYHTRDYSPEYRSRYRSVSRSVSSSPRRHYRRSYDSSSSVSPVRSRRSYSPSVSPRPRRRSYSPSVSPGNRSSSRSRTPAYSSRSGSFSSRSPSPRS
ncbi:hypothetical protein L2E82_20764 [Cichorium intybus]|uniref:Uncharacterized protein n=1 Tax=Cichorium intybus TaxID=13427 RepID=A0ACB9DV08_CICIN|nr:hypothetical protein L2E82_20764 [Cichorium intybus]